MAVTGRRPAALSNRASLPAREPPGIEAGKSHRRLECGGRTRVGASLTARLAAIQDEVVDRRLIQPPAGYRFLPSNRRQCIDRSALPPCHKSAHIARADCCHNFCPNQTGFTNNAAIKLSCVLEG